MSEVKEYHLVTTMIGELTGPIGSFFESKEGAEQAVQMIKRSNNPVILNLVEKSAFDALKAELEEQKQHVSEACAGRDNWRVTQLQLARAREVIEFYSSNFKPVENVEGGLFTYTIEPGLFEDRGSRARAFLDGEE